LSRPTRAGPSLPSARWPCRLLGRGEVLVVVLVDRLGDDLVVIADVRDHHLRPPGSSPSGPSSESASSSPPFRRLLCLLGRLSFSPRFTLAAGASAFPAALASFLPSGAALLSPLPRLRLTPSGVRCFLRAAADFLSAIFGKLPIGDCGEREAEVMDTRAYRPFFFRSFQALGTRGEARCFRSNAGFAHVFAPG